MQHWTLFDHHGSTHDGSVSVQLTSLVEGAGQRVRLLAKALEQLVVQHNLQHIEHRRCGGDSSPSPFTKQLPRPRATTGPGQRSQALPREPRLDAPRWGSIVRQGRERVNQEVDLLLNPPRERFEFDQQPEHPSDRPKEHEKRLSGSASRLANTADALHPGSGRSHQKPAADCRFGEP